MLAGSTDEPWTPVRILGAERRSRWLILCDHATNYVPDDINGGTLGLASRDMSRHIAYDPGAEGVTRYLAEFLDAPCVLTDFSRLVIDPNRGEDDPTLIMQLYDGTIIPGNRHVDASERQRRLDSYYRPYHDAIAGIAANRPDTVIVSIHSFTRQLRHRPPRPWHVGLLFADDARLSIPLLKLLESEGDLVVGENQPYSGSLAGDTIDRHGISAGRQNTLIELRNELIFDEAQQRDWAKRLARLLPLALQDAENGDDRNG